MAEPQRIYPVLDHDAEAPQPPTAPLVSKSENPTAPLVPRGSATSDGAELAEHHPPLPARTIPVTHSPPPKKRSSCCRRCLCWTTCTLLLLIIVIAAVAGILYLVFRPELPDYSINGMRISEFNLNDDMSLNATINVNITARNPNRRIGIYYESGSHIGVWYSGQRLCEGALPRFYQGHRNTTVLDVALRGQTQNATELQSSLQTQQQTTGSIPLNLRATVPVRIRLGRLRLMEMKFRVRCRLAVESLGPNEVVRVNNSRCNFRLRL